MASLLAEATGREVETINAAVSGYSPWQEATYLETEGLRYRPDLIVVGFVLNDATEKFGLVRFGGSGLGWQLDHTTSNQLTAFLSRSATLYFAGRLIQRMRHGGDLEALAKDEELARLYALLHKSETESVVRA